MKIATGNSCSPHDEGGVCGSRSSLAILTHHERSPTASRRLPEVTYEGVEDQRSLDSDARWRAAGGQFVHAGESRRYGRISLCYSSICPTGKTKAGKAGFALFSYFVARGYVVARVDIRGTGTSEGKLIEYEYSDQEQEDGEVVIDWLSKQSWSTGEVGMFGLSWGAFNSIQMAMRKPPALKAIVAIQGTDDLFRDDCSFSSMA